MLDPGSFASDRFNRWEYPVDAPGSKEGEGSAAYLFASGDDTTSFIWFLQEEPMNRTTGLDKQNWGGGWLVGWVFCWLVALVPEGVWVPK